MNEKSRVYKLFCLAVLAMLETSCGGGSANSGEQTSTSFLEEAPSTAALAAAADELVAELSGSLDEGLRQALEAKVASQAYSASSGAGTLEPQSPADLWQMIGVAAVLKGSVSTGLYCFARAAKEAPDQAAPLSQVGFALNALDRPAEAKPFLLAAHAQDPELASPLSNLGQSYKKLGQLDRAAYYLSLAVQRQPQNPTYKVKLAQVYTAAGQPVLAASLLGQALLSAPEDEEIQALAQAAGVPGTGALLRPVLGQSERAASDEGLLAQASAIEDQLRQELLTSAYEEIDSKKSAALVTRQTDQLLNLNTVGSCNEACTDDICRSQCALTLCEAEMASHDTFRETITPLAYQYEIATQPFIGEYQEQAFSLYYEHKDSSAHSDSEKENLLIRIGEVLAQEQSGILISYQSTQAAVGGDAAQVQQVCDAALEAYGEAYIASLFATQDPGFSFDLCLDGVLCVGLNNSVLSISGGELLTGEIAIDMKTGEFTLAVGIGVTDPTGTAQVGVSFKLNSTKGVGVGADVKVGGPLKLKLGKDYYLLEN